MILIRPFNKNSDYTQAVDIQRKIWGFSDVDITPPHILTILSNDEFGDCVGAFDQKKLIGFWIMIPTYEIGTVIVHQVGVLPEYQKKGVMAKMFFHLRQVAKKKNIIKAYSTFDPFMIHNAMVYLKNGGSLGRDYITNYYHFDSYDNEKVKIHSDRLKLVWYFDKTRIRRLRKLQSDSLIVELPLNLQEIEQENIELAAQIINKAKKKFINLMIHDDYSVVEFKVDTNQNTGQYIFMKIPYKDLET